MCRRCEEARARGAGIEADFDQIFENSLAGGAEVIGDYLAGLLPLVKRSGSPEEFFRLAGRPSALFHVALGGGLLQGIADAAELGREATRLARPQGMQAAASGVRLDRYSGDPIELDWFRQQAFTVSGIQQQQVLGVLRKKIEDALSGSSGWPDFRNSAHDVFLQTGIEISDAQLRTVFNTNLATAHGAGKWLEGQAAADVLPYWQYLTAGDTRVRPAHQLQDGKIYPKNHPYWNLWFPPNGYNCRCTVLEWDDAGLRRAGLVPESVLPADTPDPGFDGSFGQIGDLLQRLVQEAQIDEYTADSYELSPLEPAAFKQTVGLLFDQGAAQVADHAGVTRLLDEGRIQIRAAGEASAGMVAETISNPAEVWSWPGRPLTYIRSFTEQGHTYTAAVEVFGDVQTARVVEGTADEYRRGILAHIGR